MIDTPKSAELNLEAQRQTIEACARIADVHAEPTDTPCDFTEAYELAARKIARSIRRLLPNEALTISLATESARVEANRMRVLTEAVVERHPTVALLAARDIVSLILVKLGLTERGRIGIDPTIALSTQSDHARGLEDAQVVPASGEVEGVRKRAQSIWDKRWFCVEGEWSPDEEPIETDEPRRFAEIAIAALTLATVAAANNEGQPS
jgi:hypothetical protein